MTRATSTPVTRKRRKKEIKATEGYFGSKHKLAKTAREQLRRSWQYAYIGRKQKKRDFRSLWITRLNSAFREKGLSYSRAISLVIRAQIRLNRKQLSEMAINQPQVFDALIAKIQNP